MQNIILDIPAFAKMIDIYKQALKPSKKETNLYFKTADGQYFLVTGIIKKVAKP